MVSFHIPVKHLMLPFMGRGNTYVYHKGLQSYYKESRMLWVFVRNKWLQSRNFPLLIFFLSFLWCHIRTAYFKIIRRHVLEHVSLQRECPQNVKRALLTFAESNRSIASENSSWRSETDLVLLPHIPTSGICYLESWFPLFQTELCIPQADTETGGCRCTFSWVHEGCLWVGGDLWIFRRLYSQLGAAGKQRVGNKPKAVWLEWS